MSDKRKTCLLHDEDYTDEGCPVCLNMATYPLAIERYGRDAQIRQAVEEAGELIVVLHHHARGKATDEQVVSEIADVWIMLEQLALLFGGPTAFDAKRAVGREVDRKLKRLRERLAEVKEG